MMLDEYFNCVTEKGILATADADGKADAAIYSKPHILGEAVHWWLSCVTT